MRYKVKCVTPPDEKGRRNCVECKKDGCVDPDCGVGIVYVDEKSPFVRHGKNTAAKRRQYKKGDQEESPRRKKDEERQGDDEFLTRRGSWI